MKTVGLSLIALLAVVAVDSPAEDKPFDPTLGTLTITGKGSVIAEPDVAAVPVSIRLRCFQNREAADKALRNAINIVATTLGNAAFRGKTKLERVVVPSPTLGQQTEQYYRWVQDDDGNYQQKAFPIDACVNAWGAQVNVMLVTQKLDEVGKATKAVQEAVKSRQLSHSNPDPKDLRNTASVLLQPVNFWLTDEARKTVEAEATARAWKHHDEQFALAKQEVRLFEARYTNLNEGEPLLVNPVYAEFSPVASSGVKLGGYGSDEGEDAALEATVISAGGITVRSQVTVTWNIRTPDRCSQ